MPYTPTEDTLFLVEGSIPSARPIPDSICENLEGGNMINTVATDALMSSGMKCLVDKLGIVEAEMFISVIREDTFDYRRAMEETL